MKRFKKIIVVTMILSLSLCTFGCNKNKDNEESTTTDSVTDSTDEKLQGDVITIANIKEKYGVEKENSIKPFYNVEQNTAFTFHFKSNVEPCFAITVHTDSKCEENSLVYQINHGYKTENGIDVVVKPGKPVLNSSDRNDGELDNYSWGNAPIYYLCIRYDMDATTPTLLEEPIIVPFTVKSVVSVPTLTCSITNQGEFQLNWLPVEEAESYNIYECNKVRDTSNAKDYTRQECGYVGDHLVL